MAVGVICVERQPRPEPPDGFKLQRVVARSPDALHLGYGVKPGINAAAGATGSFSTLTTWSTSKVVELGESCRLVSQTSRWGRPQSRVREVQGHRHLEAVILGADVAGLERQLFHYLVFHSSVPLLVAGVLQVLVHGGNVPKVKGSRVKDANRGFGRGL